MNLLSKIGEFFGIVGRHMPQLDPVKIQAKLSQLNATGQPGAPYWLAADGINAVTQINIKGGLPIFDPNTGIPLKVFANTQTGEIKIFDARVFAVTPPPTVATPSGTTT